MAEANNEVKVFLIIKRKRLQILELNEIFKLNNEDYMYIFML